MFAPASSCVADDLVYISMCSEAVDQVMHRHGSTVFGLLAQHQADGRYGRTENALPDSVDFASLNKFKQSILHIDFNEHLVCFKC